jgi:hypothetical protein
MPRVERAKGREIGSKGRQVVLKIVLVWHATLKALIFVLSDTGKHATMSVLSEYEVIQGCFKRLSSAW